MIATIINPLFLTSLLLFRRRSNFLKRDNPLKLTRFLASDSKNDFICIGIKYNFFALDLKQPLTMGHTYDSYCAV